jgi:hypothetical protein
MMGGRRSRGLREVQGVDGCRSSRSLVIRMEIATSF